MKLTHDAVQVDICEVVYKEYTSQVKHFAARPLLGRNCSKLGYELYTPSDICKWDDTADAPTISILQGQYLQQTAIGLWFVSKC